MKEGFIYGYMFTYNHFTEKWCAFKSEDQAKYFNSGESEYQATDIFHIIEVLCVRNIRQDSGLDNEKSGY